MVRTTASRWDANELRLYYWYVVVIIAISCILIRASFPIAGPLEPSERVPAAPSTTRLRNHASNTIYGPSHALYLYFSFSSHLQVQPDTSTLHPAPTIWYATTRPITTGGQRKTGAHAPTHTRGALLCTRACMYSQREGATSMYFYAPRCFKFTSD